MTTEARIRANRRNAQLSTGPKTSAGKKRVTRNALKHGLLTRKMIVLDENPRALLKLWREFYEQYQPVGAIETLLLERTVSVIWRMRRMGRVEADVLALKEGDGRSHYRYGQAFLGDCYHGKSMPPLSRYETALERSLYRALEALRKEQEARKRDEFDAQRDTLDAKRDTFDTESDASGTGPEAPSKRPNGVQVPAPQANGAG